MPFVSRFTYIYPSTRETAFYEISMEHIEQLRKRVSVRTIPEEYLDKGIPKLRSGAVVHPIMHVFLGDNEKMMPKRLKRLHRILEDGRKIGGFDVADTDRLSQAAVGVLNKMNLVVVPSRHSKECYESSGVETQIEVLPHGLNDAFLSNSFVGVPRRLNYLFWLRRRTKSVFCLFHLAHSGYRKGADLVREVMGKIQKEYGNVYLVVKRGSGLDPFLGNLLKLRSIEISGWIPYDELRLLYDLCDICLVPSRGGGFERNALEAMSRGLVTLVPNAGCFLDYAGKAVKVRVARKVRVYEGNPIHIGHGHEVDVGDFYDKLSDVIENLDEYRARAIRHAREVQEKYSWDKIGDRLFNILNKHNFL